MKNKKIIIFMPSMEGGGVEKNLIILANYLAKKLNRITLITYDNHFRSKLDKKIKLISSKNKKSSSKKYIKYFLCLILLIKELLKDKGLVISFQANIYCIILSVILGFKVLTN